MSVCIENKKFNNLEVCLPKDSELNNMRNLTQNFCFRLNALRRRIVILRNDLIAFKLGQEGKLRSVSYLILSPEYNIFNTGKQAITKVAYWIERSKQRKELANLNDHMLKDIGYSREEALIEGSKPFWK